MTAQDLKNSILQRAIEGKLVPQRQEEGTAKELLAKIRAEKAQLIKEKNIKKSKPLPAITDDEKPFDIPESWEWVRFGDISINLDSERIPLSVTQRRKLDKIYDYYGASGVIDKVDKYLFDRPLMLIGEDGANLLTRSKPIAFIARGKYWVNNHAHVIDFPAGINMRYVTFYMNAINLAAYVTGTAQPKMNQARMNSILIAIPPLAEQHRIVAKIEELQPDIDAYDKAQTELTAIEQRFPDAMKKSLLQYAIEGKLVPQRQEEGTAKELLAKIRAEKARLIKEKKIKKDKPLPAITDDEKPFDIPESWEWVRLGELGEWCSGATPSRQHPEYFGGKIPWLKTGDLNDGYIKDVPEFITEEGFQHSSTKINPVGSVLIAMYGATIGKLGILQVPATTNQACCACELFQGIYNKYLFYFLLANRNFFIRKGMGGAQPNISKAKIIATTIPLPPLAEQHRIVARLEDLLPLCDALAAQL